ncbi:MAG TPA: hypothetical protein VLV87_02245 [Gammaproteobacteria bacterium]|nr:hypothetical protein [Gammaproteobacteria bacterium]
MLLLKNPTATAPPSGWIQVKPLHAILHFVRPQPGADVPFTVFLQDGAGKQVYLFECHTGDYADTSELAWSGDYQCALFPFQNDTVSAVNLLAADNRKEQSNDWYNRGRLLARQLQGACLQYPEYSTLRHFRLRGMDLTVGYSDIGWQEGKLERFTLTLDVTPDPDAKSPMVESAAGERPPSSCYPGPNPAK